jgi:hypothetical protein
VPSSLGRMKSARLCLCANALYWRDKVTQAKNQPGVGNNPGKVVAELTFGFWVELLKSSNHIPLWMARNLRSAFPNAPGLNRRMIYSRLKAIQLLRNRISHHEPFLIMNLFLLRQIAYTTG